MQIYQRGCNSLGHFPYATLSEVSSDGTELQLRSAAHLPLRSLAEKYPRAPSSCTDFVKISSCLHPLWSSFASTSVKGVLQPGPGLHSLREVTAALRRKGRGRPVIAWSKPHKMSLARVSAVILPCIVHRFSNSLALGTREVGGEPAPARSPGAAGAKGKALPGRVSRAYPAALQPVFYALVG
jgi:hypothetical protein